MEYTDAMEYIRRIQKCGISPGLESIGALCEELGHPEDSLCIIHIAGTNGKGSVGAFIDSILRHAGYNVCRYVSPAVSCYEERLMYNGEIMTRVEAAHYISIVKQSADALIRSGKNQPTQFEIETAMAFLYCRDKKCDYAILETGMGGRLDAVNVIKKSRVSVITRIGIDHTAFLGCTITEIAREKAGIIKENGVVITSRQKSAVMTEIIAECRKKHARLTECHEPHNICGGVFDYDDMTDLYISLRGAFQPYNAALAIEVCTELGIGEEDIRCGLKNTIWHARFEQISREPVFIIDGAHNAEAAYQLAETIKSEFDSRRINFIIGVLKDKDYEKIAKYTAPLANRIYTVTPDNPRALSGNILAKTVKTFNPDTEDTDIITAVKKCMADKEAVTIAFGSLSYLNEVVKAVRQ